MYTDELEIDTGRKINLCHGFGIDGDLWWKTLGHRECRGEIPSRKGKFINFKSIL